MMTFTVYALFDKRKFRVIRYIGQTGASLNHRLSQHLMEACVCDGLSEVIFGGEQPVVDCWWRCYCAKCEWIRSLAPLACPCDSRAIRSLVGERLGIEPILAVSSRVEALELEASVIRYLDQIGQPLTNHFPIAPVGYLMSKKDYLDLYGSIIGELL